MTDVKSLISEVKKFVESSTGESLGSVLDAFIGAEFAAKLELTKNQETVKYLRANSEQESNLKELNDFTIRWLEVVQKKMMHQHLLDFSDAVEDVIKRQVESDPNLEIYLCDFRSLLNNPAEFVNDFFHLSAETDELESLLSQMVSLPVFERFDSAQMMEPFKMLSEMKTQSTCSVLKILTTGIDPMSRTEVQSSSAAPHKSLPQLVAESSRSLPANISDRIESPESLLVVTKPTENNSTPAKSRIVKLRA